MSARLNKPYKIIAFRQARYGTHYNIPSSESLVVPTKQLGDEVLCDIRWEDDNGELKVLHQKMFLSENLVQLDPLADEKLFEIWDHYYSGVLLN
jgi:hypothetical protein